MSKHYVCFVPMEANFIPNGAARDAAIAILRKAWPRAREITSETADYVVFRDCGENFQSVRCPHCGATLDVDVWQDLMDGDFSEEGGFRLDALQMQCCGAISNLNELRYEWPQGFSRFALGATHSGGEVPQELLARLESALGCRLRVIYQMY